MQDYKRVGSYGTMLGVGDQCKRVPEISDEDIDAIMDTTGLPPGAKTAVLQMFGFLDPEVQLGLINQKYRLVDMDFYATKVLPATTSGTLLDDQTTRQAGISNIDKGTIGSIYKNFICYAVGVDGGTGATESAADFTGAFPLAMLNGEMEIRVDSKIIWGYQPIHGIVLASGDQSLTSSRTKVLQAPFMVDWQKKLNVSVKFAAATAATGVMRVRLSGIVIISA